MKRGLKSQRECARSDAGCRSRDFPDEEGTEMKDHGNRAKGGDRSRDFPDEEGTEI